MVRLGRTALVLAFLLSLLSPTAPGQGGHTLQGKVILPNGSPPPHSVKVTLTYKGRRIHETFTDLSGRFLFSGLGQGAYELIADTDGKTFETTSITTDVSSFGRAPQNITQNIQLRPKITQPVARAATVSVDEVAADVPEKARKEYQKGLNRAADDQPEEAAKHFRAAVESHPAYYAALVALAEQYTKLGRYEEAIGAYQKAIELKPGRADGHIGLGITFVKREEYVQAVTHLRRGIEIDKSSSTAHLFLGLAEMMKGDYLSAEYNLMRAYEIAKPSIAHVYLANLYELRGELGMAIEHLEAYLKENPGSPKAAQIKQAITKLRKKSSGKT